MTKSRLNPAWLLAGFLLLILCSSVGWMGYRYWLARDSGTDEARPAVATTVTPEVAALPALVAAQYAADGVELRTQLTTGRAAYHAGDYPAAIPALRTVIALSNGDTATQAAFFLLGNIYDDLGQYADAAFCQEQALRGGPSAAAWHNLGLTELHRGDNVAAQRAATRADELDPGNPDHAALLAVACERLNQDSQAMLAAQRSVASDSRSAQRLLNLALLTARRGARESALALLKQAVVAPGPPAARQRAAEELALLLFELNRTEETVAAMQLALTFAPADARLLHNYGLALTRAKFWTRAEAALRQAAANAPQRPESYYALADALTGLGRRREAIAAVQRGLELDPENTARYYQLAEMLIEETADEAARLTLEQLLVIGPPLETRLAARVQLACLAARHNRPEDALALMREAAALSPQTPWVLFNRGLLAWRVGEKTEAYRDIDNALRLETKNPLMERLREFARTRADLLLRDRRYTDAITAYNRLIEVDKESIHARAQLGWLHQQRHEHPAAGDAYRQALARQPEAPLAYLLMLNLATVQAESGKRGEALEILRKTATMFPNRCESYHNAALFSAAQGRADEAMAFIRVAERLAPEAAAVPLTRGDLLWRAGLRAEAAAAWARALELDPALLAARYNLDYYRRQTEVSP